MQDERICRRCRVSGRVQGVSYRAFAQRGAQALGVTGHARNLPDGSVEVLACGAPEAVAALCEGLRRGPPHAEVTALECIVVAEPPPIGFRIL
jgi:acylphosphatase